MLKRVELFLSSKLSAIMEVLRLIEMTSEVEELYSI